MLQFLRDSMKYLAWVLWAVIAVFILFVFVDFGGGVPQGSPSRAAATVGSTDVTYGEYEREYRDLEEQMRTRLGEQYTPELARQLRLAQQALDRVVNRKILVAEARQMGLRASDAEVREAILEIPAFTAQGRFVGDAAYDNMLRRFGYTPQSFEQAIREQILVQRLLAAVEGGIVVADATVDQRYREQVERARIDYVRLPYAAVGEGVEVTDEELAAYFAEHRDEYQVPEERVGRYLLLDQRALREEIAIDDAAVATYYEANRDEFAEEEQVRARHVLVSTAERSVEEARQRIAEARARLAAGEEFAAVAGDLSDDPGSAARGGDLGYFGRGRMVPPFEQAAFAAEPGELVGPVETDFGLHLVEVLDRREARVRPLEEVTELVRGRLANDRLTVEGEERMTRYRQTVVADGEAAMERLAAESPAVETGTTEPFRAQGPITPLGPAPAVNQAAFALAEGEVSEPVRTPRGWVVLRLAEVRPPRLPELAEVEGRVRQDVRQQKLEARALDRLAAARERLIAGETDLAAVAAELGLTVESSEEFGHGGFVPGLGMAPEVAELAFELPEGAVGGPLAREQGAVLFTVAAKTAADPAELAQRRPALRTELVQEELDRLVASLVNARREALGVTYDRNLVEAWAAEDEAEG